MIRSCRSVPPHTPRCGSRPGHTSRSIRERRTACAAPTRIGSTRTSSSSSRPERIGRSRAADCSRISVASEKEAAMNIERVLYTAKVHTTVAANDDLSVIEALRRGDETAFARLVDLYHASLRRVARLYISDRAVADEVVQDTWLGVIQGIWAFEGRSSLKTWIFRILIN